jgi:S-adenosylmethionine:tRNA ribosyltransferase-isomerase
LKTSDFDFDLPERCIAQTPLEPRDLSRLLVYTRTSGDIQHASFRDIGSFLRENDLLVMNETRVFNARLAARKIPGGGHVEILLIRQLGELEWEVIVRGKALGVGKQLLVEGGNLVEIVSVEDTSKRIVRFQEPIEPYLEKVGHVPLPPYIHTHLEDPERYQTVYARQFGSVAAPTAGLHFTENLLSRLVEKGIGYTKVVLHVGLDTFAPVREADPRLHKIHTEWCQLSPDTADRVNKTKRAGGRIIAVGTTSVRTLETAARGALDGDTISPYEGYTDLFILPGYQFRCVDAMVTNFHLPRSTLIMLVSAFIGVEKLLSLYQLAIKTGYRFYSFGDAMLII